MQNHDIGIHVKTQFIDYGETNEPRFVYAYTITIANHGQHPAQLISRYWKIRDANDNIHEVEGLGVVGEQPRLLPGETYTYTSNAIIETETGIMEGYYLMQRDDGDTFRTPVPAFALVPAYAIH